MRLGTRLPKAFSDMYAYLNHCLYAPSAANLQVSSTSPCSSTCEQTRHRHISYGILVMATLPCSSTCEQTKPLLPVCRYAYRYLCGQALYTHVSPVYSYGVCSHGLCSHGPCSYGLCCIHTWVRYIVMAYIVMACVVMAFVVYTRESGI